MTTSIANEVRAALKTALAPVAANVYDHVPEAPITPAIVIVPDSPYLELRTISDSTLHLRVNLSISCLVAYLSNPGSLDQLEQLVVSTLQNIPGGYEVGIVERPTVTQVGASNLLISDIRVSTYYTHTN